MRAVGTYTWFGYDIPLSDELKLISAIGFDSICTWWSEYSSDSTPPREKQAELAQNNGLTLEHAHIPYYGCDNLWRDNLDGETLFTRTKNDIRAAAELVPTLVMHPFEKLAPDGGSYECFIDRMKRLRDHADKYQVRLAVENLGERELIRRIIHELAESDYIGLCFDSGHNNVVSHDDFSLLEEFADRVFALHLHDNDSNSDQHLIPFLGNISWDKLISALSQTSFCGSLMLESSYPFDYSIADTDPNYIFDAPSIPVEDYLSQSLDACRRLNEMEKA